MSDAPSPPPPPPLPTFSGSSPAPPPPPGPAPGASSLAARPPPPAAGAGRGALLTDITKGARLKKAATNDRSAPAIGNESKGSAGAPVGIPPAIPNLGRPTGLAPPPPIITNRGRSNSDIAGAPSGVGDAGLVPPAPHLAGLFAGGIPKLRKTGGGVDTGANSDAAYRSDPETSRSSVPRPPPPPARGPPGSLTPLTSATSPPRSVGHGGPAAAPLGLPHRPPLPAASSTSLRPTSSSDGPSNPTKGSLLLPPLRPPPGIGKPPPPPVTSRKPSMPTPQRPSLPPSAVTAPPGPPPPPPPPPPPSSAPRLPPSILSYGGALVPPPPALPPARSSPAPPASNGVAMPSLAMQAARRAVADRISPAVAPPPPPLPPPPPAPAPVPPPPPPPQPAVPPPNQHVDVPIASISTSPPPPPPTLPPISRSSTQPPHRSMLDPSRYTLTNGSGSGGASRSGSSSPKADGHAGRNGFIQIEDRGWKFQDESQLPKPREFLGTPKHYRAGRGSSVPLDLSTFR